MLAIHVTPADVGDRAEVGRMAEAPIRAIWVRNLKRRQLDTAFSLRSSCCRRLSSACPAAQTMGYRTILRLDNVVPTSRQGLRTMRPNPRRSSSRCIRVYHAQKRRCTCRWFITTSRLRCYSVQRGNGFPARSLRQHGRRARPPQLTKAPATDKSSRERPTPAALANRGPPARTYRKR